MSFHTCVHYLCHTRITYIHSTYVGMSRVCIHLGVHDHHVSNGTYRESLDMTYQCVANEVLKTPTAKNSAIVMAVSKQFLADYLLKSFANVKGHHLVGSSLEVVMDKFNILASSSCYNFVSRSKRFLRSEMRTMNSILALKDPSAFKFVHGSRFVW
jgi:enoyl-[acyl-carrier-protein] reductase (NADH)